jgi:O-acetyl-ADP-ribose deacetylase (regulator of RNase III)
MPMFLEGRLEIVRADITTLEVDAIVSAASEGRAIHVAAALELLGG